MGGDVFKDRCDILMATDLVIEFDLEIVFLQGRSEIKDTEGRSQFVVLTLRFELQEIYVGHRFLSLKLL